MTRPPRWFPLSPIRWPATPPNVPALKAARHHAPARSWYLPLEDKDERRLLRDYFRENVMPVLTPLAVDASAGTAEAPADLRVVSGLTTSS